MMMIIVIISLIITRPDLRQVGLRQPAPPRHPPGPY